LLLLALCCAEQNFVVSSGRYRQNADSSVSFDWSGIEISFLVNCNVESPELTFNLSSSLSSDQTGSHTFRLDSSTSSAVFAAFPIQANVATLFSSSLSNVSVNQNVVVRLTKITEALFGVVTLYSITSKSCQITSPSSSSFTEKARSVEFIGDSLTCGYGVLGTRFLALLGRRIISNLV
jgi:hypothetical protein